ncbi:zinc transporter 8 [Pelomyxa schiedti]|nr:zinc transporter 8 [Pelomyxa schiedti]
MTMEKSEALRIAAIFIILVVSLLGVCFPIVAQAIYPKFSSTNIVFSSARAFGAGVILATGLIHILAEAGEVLGEAFPDMDYPLAFALCLVSICTTLAIEQGAAAFFEMRHAGSKHSCETGGSCKESGAVVVGLGEVVTASESSAAPKGEGELQKETSSSKTYGTDSSASTTERMASVGHRLHHHHQHQHNMEEIPGGNQGWIVAHILELGIALHSVIIGLALGVSTDAADVRALIIALSFHQFFEGIALGVCILEAKLSLFRTAFMVGIFSVTTPLGIGIGIAIGEVNSKTEGILESLSAGILLYMALVDMVSEDFQKTGGHPVLYRFVLVAAFLVGSAAMAIIGMWA